VDRPLVIVVCGASGVGKSSVARPLAQQTGVPLAEADDLVTALKALTTATTHPALHHWDTHPATAGWTAQQIVEHTLTVAAELAVGFRAVIADHIAFAAPMVIEGDCLTPDLIDGLGTAARAVVISEPDEDQIVANLLAREPHAGEQRFRAHVSATLDAELIRRAQTAGVPVVPARPFQDAPERVARALQIQLGRDAFATKWPVGRLAPADITS
jgi:2-phosphoglycerate kinase